MHIIVNGKERECGNGITLADLLVASGLRPEAVVVERNGDIVPAPAFAATGLMDGDRLEILQFVGGG
ncbi:MAG: sulfur carrier protein ThiS [Desulfovibrionaceae bacterium]